MYCDVHFSLFWWGWAVGDRDSGRPVLSLGRLSQPTKLPLCQVPSEFHLISCFSSPSPFFLKKYLSRLFFTGPFICVCYMFSVCDTMFKYLVSLLKK